MKVKEFVRRFNWECTSLEHVQVDTGEGRFELPGEVLRRPESMAWRRGYLRR